MSGTLIALFTLGEGHQATESSWEKAFQAVKIHELGRYKAPQFSVLILTDGEMNLPSTS